MCVCVCVVLAPREAFAHILTPVKCVSELSCASLLVTVCLLIHGPPCCETVSSVGARSTPFPPVLFLYAPRCKIPSFSALPVSWLGR